MCICNLTLNACLLCCSGVLTFFRAAHSRTLTEGVEGGGDARVAQAPRNVQRKIPTLAELETAVQATMPTVHEGGLDLAVLTATLVPAAMLEEKDEAWDFDGLLREVTDELTSTPKTVISASISSSMVAAMAKEKKSKGDGSSKPKASGGKR